MTYWDYPGPGCGCYSTTLELVCEHCGKQSNVPGKKELGAAWFDAPAVCEHCGARHDTDGYLEPGQDLDPALKKEKGEQDEEHD